MDVMKNFARSFTFFSFSAFLLLVVACGKEGTNFSVGESIERFSGREVTPSIDILWVVDNSGTMFPNQENLARNFDSFIRSFTSRGFDFHISIVSSDPDDGGNFLGTPTVITGSTPNYIDVFKRDIKVGDTGSSGQKGLDTIERALSADKLGDENSGFWRDSAHLAVVVVSDADDSDSDTNPTNVQAFLEENKPDVMEPETNAFYDGFSIHAIIAKRDRSNCNQPNLVEEGRKFIDLAESVGGFVGDICEDEFSDGLSSISDRILQFITYVALSGQPSPSTIRVKVDGVLVANDANNGWTYDSVGNKIIFHGDALPAASSFVEVSYISSIFDG